MFKRCSWLIALLASAFAAQAAEQFESLTVTQHGKGRPVVLIHGLNSSAATWDELCDRFATQIACYQVQLPGFAGAAPIKSDQYLIAMRDQLIGFIRANRLDAPIVAGHSLGGVIALMIGIEQPTLPSGLFIVDSLPFLPAAQTSGATLEEIHTMAGYTRRTLLAASDEQHAQQMKFSARTMARGAERIAVLEQWSATSDRATTANAMYAVMTTDLRDDIVRVAVPTVVLASWSKNKPAAGAREATERTFEMQYAKLAGVRVVTTEDANHFIMWDDPQLTDRELTQLLATTQIQRP